MRPDDMDLGAIEVYRQLKRQNNGNLAVTLVEAYQLLNTANESVDPVRTELLRKVVDVTEAAIVVTYMESEGYWLDPQSGEWVKADEE